MLTWSAQIELPSNAEGTIFFTVRVLTALGTNVEDTTSVAVSTVVAGKAVVMEHQGVGLELAADAVDEGTRILLVAEHEGASQTAAKVGTEEPQNELQLLASIKTYPVGLALRQSGLLRFRKSARRSDGIYRPAGNGWRFIGPENESVAIKQLGYYGVLRDETPPRIQLIDRSIDLQNGLEAELADGGSGVDPQDIHLSLDGTEVQGQFSQGRLWWSLPAVLPAGLHTLYLEVGDRAGNRATSTIEFFFSGRVLPQVFELEQNYPNPFNPETTIPFAIPSNWPEGVGVELDIFNVSGQLVRQLLKKSRNSRGTTKSDGTAAMRPANEWAVESISIVCKREVSGASRE